MTFRRTKLGQRIRNSGLGRHIRTQWQDPEVKKAGKDVLILYGLHKGLKQLPRIQQRAWAKVGKMRGHIDTVDDFLHQASDMQQGRGRRKVFALKRGANKALRFKRRGLVALAKMGRRVKGVGKFLSFVR